MKIANVHIGTIHRNVRISNWANAIFISVSYSHISFIFSYQFHILTFQCMVPTWTFEIFISVSYFHISFIFSYQFHILSHLSMYGSYVDVWYFHISFIFSHQFAILMSQLHHFLMCGFATSQPRVRLKQTISPCFKVELITPDEDKRPRKNYIFVLIQCHYELELIYSDVSHSSPWKTKIN